MLARLVCVPLLPSPPPLPPFVYNRLCLPFLFSRLCWFSRVFQVTLRRALASLLVHTSRSPSVCVGLPDTRGCRHPRKLMYTSSGHMCSVLSPVTAIDLAVARAVEVGCRSFAIFTKSQRRFDAKPLDAASIRKFKVLFTLCHTEGKHKRRKENPKKLTADETGLPSSSTTLSAAWFSSFSLVQAACASKGFPPHLVLPHCGYMVNLGAPDREALARSKQSMRLEMQRCAQLGLRYLNFHAGSTKVSTLERASHCRVCLNGHVTWAAISLTFFPLSPPPSTCLPPAIATTGVRMLAAPRVGG